MSFPRFAVYAVAATTLALAATLLNLTAARPVAAGHLCGGFLNHAGGTTTFSTSTTRHTTFTTVQAPGGPVEQFRTRVVAQIGVTVVFDETVDGSPTSTAVQDALARARIALVAQLGPNAVITGPEQTQTNRSQVNQNPTNRVTHTETSVTTTQSLGPGTILVGPDQSITCFIAAGTTNINTNTHTETFVESTLLAPAFLNFAQLQLTGLAGQSVRPVIPQVFQLPVLGALFANRSRNKDKQTLQVIITPNIIRPAE